MKSTKWDQKLAELGKEIDAHFGTIIVDDQKRKQEYLSLKNEIQRQKNIFYRNTAKIQQLSVNQSFLSEAGKTIIFWSLRLIEKIEQYYSQQVEINSTFLWISLIEIRSIGYSKKSKIFIGNAVKQIEFYHKRLKKIHSELNYKLNYFEAIQRNLKKRYEKLVIASSNKLNSSFAFNEESMSQNAAYILHYTEYLDDIGADHKDEKKLDLLLKIQNESHRLGLLVAQSQPVRCGAQAKEAISHAVSKNQAEQNLLKTFDYLNLDNEFS